MKRSIPSVVLWGSVILLVSCSLFTNRDDLQELEKQREKWTRAGIHHYAFETRKGCFCAVELMDWTRVEVKDETIVDLTVVDSGESPQEAIRDQYKTLDQLFDWGEQVIREADVYDIDYDEEFGFPLHIQYDWNKRITDDDGQVDVQNFGTLD